MVTVAVAAAVMHAAPPVSGFGSTTTDAPIQYATYNAIHAAPVCGRPGSACDTGVLATGRRSLPGRAELHQPNTIRTTCADGPGGAVAGPEQIDRLKVSTLDGGVFEPGKIVTIEVLVQAAPTPADDSLDLYYLADIRNMAFTYITTLKPSVAGPQVLTAFYRLPAGGLLQGVRARFRYRGDPGICNLTGSVPDEDDVDDVMFRVGTRTNVAGDFDGDATSELALFRPSDGTWPNLQSTTYFGVGATYVLGLARDAIVPGDYDGDGTVDPAVYRPSTGQWIILQSSTGYTSSLTISWGLSTDLPVPGDYDGDGITEPAIYRPSTGLWAMLKSSNGFGSASYVYWGLSTDQPMAADYDGDGKTDPAIYRPSTGLWAALRSSVDYGSSLRVSWGLSTDVAVPGDYDGDGKADPAIYRPSTGLWAMLKSGVGYSSALYRTWGVSGDIPVPGDYDGDGRTDIAVYHPSTGDWSTLASSANFNASMFRTLGSSGDIPVLQRPR